MTSDTPPVASIAGQHLGHDRRWPRRVVRLIANAIAVARYHSTPCRCPVGVPTAAITYHHAELHEQSTA